MRVEVFVGGWEHACCGESLRRGDAVEWTCIIESDGSVHETHHDLDGLRVTRVEGTVVDLRYVPRTGESTRIEHIPSGRALSGFDEHDEGKLFAIESDDVLTATSETFVVVVEQSG
ncbi:DUF6578 domain-containing protein [Agromyces allii]|uniref:Uncharacterized protein n=1 Tax=Agromyces allii TaxID=393607 RepID=A0ABP5C5S2_9MICO|nr:DUF6578 domain-containing protein [Agromyces allii]